MKRHDARGAAVALLLLASASAWSGESIAGCEAIQASLGKALRWRQAAPGMDVAQVAFGSDTLRDLTIVRVSNSAYRFRSFDLRDIGAINRRRGYYSPPQFSIRELRRTVASSALIASAGMTKSYSEPIPAGFLRVAGETRSSPATKDATLDGVVCLSDGVAPAILSEVVAGHRRAPGSVGHCRSGFQAGPVLVAHGERTVSDHHLKTERVVFGLDAAGSSYLASSSGATTAALACALSSPALQVSDAIALQGDSLSGIDFGASFTRLLSSTEFGNIDATVASALIVEPRLLAPTSASVR
jgi:hypothetical protein